MTKGFLSFAALLFLAVTTPAATSQSSDDLWDLGKGNTVTASSGAFESNASLGMFGGAGSGAEPGTTIFSGGSPCFVEWRTPTAVTVNQLRLFSRGDNDTSFRTFSKFTLKVKSSGSSTFDATVFTWNPAVPFIILDRTNWLILDTNVTAFTAREFRAEFQAVDGGPRVMELDAFGPPPSAIPVIVEDPLAATAWVGQTATFAVNANAQAPLTYVWKHEGTNVVLSSHIESPDGKSLRINNVTLADGGAYSVLVTNTAGQVESKPANLTVNVDANAPNLIGYWSFDEPSGSVATDQTGSFPGTIHNAIRVPGRVGGALEFNGTSSYVYVGGQGSALQLARTNYTIAWWQKRGDSTGWHEDIICMDDGGDYSGGWQIYLPFGTAGIALVHSDGVLGENNVWFDAAMTDSSWRHYAVTFDGTSRKFYVDGVLAGTRPTERGIRTDGDDPLLFGAMQIQSGTVLNFFKGTLDEIRIYNRPLAAEEISILGPGKDTNAPVVTITSPVAGQLAGSSVVRLEGDITDDRGVQSARWQRNGVDMGPVTLSSGHFSFDATIVAGETRLKVIGADAAGNEGSAEVTVSTSPTAQSSDDLWDVSRGTILTASSPTFPEQNGPGFLGGGGFLWEPGQTVFSDGQTNGFVHFVEWKTAAPVTVSTIRVYAGGDGEIYSNGREFGRFTLKTKSPGSSDFDVTVLTYIPPHPYNYVDLSTLLILETNVPAFASQEFRGEFEQIDLRAEGWNAPRVVELDAFGPGSSGPPQIVGQPTPKTGFSGANASFIVGATGSAPLTYQWRREGTNLTESAHFAGVNSWALTINNLTADDAGDYSVVVTNPLDEAVSQNAHLTVEVDANAPVVAITSPVAGTQSASGFTLAGTVDEPNGISSVRWELNSRSMGALTLSNGHFSLSAQNLDAGENLIRVIATDISGNVGAAEVAVNWTIPRLLVLDAAPTQQEGGRVSIPVSLVSTGAVGGATFLVSFNANYLADAQLEWSDAVSSGFTTANLQSSNRVRASFALPGTSLASGKVNIGTLSFRTRSVQANFETPISLALEDIASEAGDPYTTENSVRGTTVKITKRKIIADNNANDRLDVGDASLIMRLLARLDIPRSWDTAANDINHSFTLDSGDVIRVLRAVVGLDPQPSATAPLLASKKSIANASLAAAAAANGSVQIVADKPTATVGEKVTIEVRLAGQTKAVSGASFRLEYPVDALRLDNAASHQVGGIAPAGSVAIWNLSPSQNNYVTQNGAISLGISSATAWPTNNGVLARFTFTVQPGATAQYGWPVVLKNLELSRDGFNTDAIGNTSWTFVGRAVADASFTPSISFNADGSAKLTLHGDVGATYRIEASNDLVNWSEVGTYLSADGSIAVNDAAGNGASARFYKATLVQ
jgi:hypothetical protein